MISHQGRRAHFLSVMPRGLPAFNIQPPTAVQCIRHPTPTSVCVNMVVPSVCVSVTWQSWQQSPSAHWAPAFSLQVEALQQEFTHSCRRNNYAFSSCFLTLGMNRQTHGVCESISLCVRMGVYCMWGVYVYVYACGVCVCVYACVCVCVSTYLHSATVTLLPRLYICVATHRSPVDAVHRGRVQQTRRILLLQEGAELLLAAATEPLRILKPRDTRAHNP